MDIMGYQAATPERELKVKRVWQVLLDHVVRRGPSGTDTDHRNWKQCAWRYYDGRDIGLIKVCRF